MTRAEILIVFVLTLIATSFVGPMDYEDALVQDAIRKDPPQIVFEPKGELNYLTQPVQRYCTATVNGRCYVSSTDKMKYGE